MRRRRRARRARNQWRQLIRPGRAIQFDRFLRVQVAHPVENSAPARARKNQFRERNHADLGCPDRRTKTFFFLKIRNHGHLAAVPLPARGALRDRHERWVRDAMDAVARETNVASADGEAVWSWRTDAGVELCR